jgi:hypothetical protein
MTPKGWVLWRWPHLLNISEDIRFLQNQSAYLILPLVFCFGLRRNCIPSKVDESAHPACSRDNYCVLDIIRSLVFHLKHSVSETRFCLHLQEEPTQLDPIYRASPYLRTPAPTQTGYVLHWCWCLEIIVLGSCPVLIRAGISTILRVVSWLFAILPKNWGVIAPNHDVSVHRSRIQRRMVRSSVNI